MAFAPYVLMGIQAISALSSASAASKSADYNSQIAQQNATIATQQGVADAEKQDRKARMTIGAMTANFGASGVDSTQGSPMDVLQQSVRMAALDNLTTRYNADLKSVDYLDKANLNSAAASSASTAGVLGAGGAIAKGYAGIKANAPPGNTIPGVSDAGIGYNQSAGLDALDTMVA